MDARLRHLEGKSAKSDSGLRAVCAANSAAFRQSLPIEVSNGMSVSYARDLFAELGVRNQRSRHRRRMPPAYPQPKHSAHARARGRRNLKWSKPRHASSPIASRTFTFVPAETVVGTITRFASTYSGRTVRHKVQHLDALIRGQARVNRQKARQDVSGSAPQTTVRVICGNLSRSSGQICSVKKTVRFNVGKMAENDPINSNRSPGCSGSARKTRQLQHRFRLPCSPHLGQATRHPSSTSRPRSHSGESDALRNGASGRHPTIGRSPAHGARSVQIDRRSHRARPEYRRHTRQSCVYSTCSSSKPKATRSSESPGYREPRCVHTPSAGSPTNSVLPACATRFPRNV